MATGTASRRWPGNSTPSSRRSYGIDVAPMAWDARNLISTQVRTVLGLRDLVQSLCDLRGEGRRKTTSIAQRGLVGPARADVQRLDIKQLRVPQRQAQTLEAREVARAQVRVPDALLGCARLAGLDEPPAPERLVLPPHPRRPHHVIRGVRALSVGTKVGVRHQNTAPFLKAALLGYQRGR